MQDNSSGYSIDKVTGAPIVFSVGEHSITLHPLKAKDFADITNKIRSDAIGAISVCPTIDVLSKRNAIAIAAVRPIGFDTIFEQMTSPAFSQWVISNQIKKHNPGLPENIIDSIPQTQLLDILLAISGLGGGGEEKENPTAAVTPA